MVVGAKRVLREAKIDQWQDANGYPNEEVFLDDIKNQTSFVAVDGGVVIGHGTITFGDEPMFQTIYDGAWQSNQPYGVIHRLFVCNKTTGKGVGAFVMMGLEQVARNKGVLYIRSDTHEDNLPMQKLFNKVGYSRAGVIFYKPNRQYKRIAFDKVVASGV